MWVASQTHAKASDTSPGICADHLTVPALSMHRVLSRINIVFRWSALYKGSETFACCDAVMVRLQHELAVQLGVQQTFSIQNAASVTEELECSYLWLFLGKLLIFYSQCIADTAMRLESRSVPASSPPHFCSAQRDVTTQRHHAKYFSMCVP